MPGTYKLFDHPDAYFYETYGSNYPYGLRMDSLDGGYDKKSTFSVEQTPADIMLMWDGGSTATLAGKVRRNNYSNDVWDVSYTLTGVTSFADPNDGWYATGGAGTLSMGSTVVTLTGKQDMTTGYAFVFANDGHRCNNEPFPCASNAIVGRGWMEGSGANDWIFIAEKKPGDGGGGDGEIPEPGTLALFGLGLVGLRQLRRRRDGTV